MLDEKHVNWIDLSWPRGNNKSAYPATLLVTMVNGAGVLGRICTLVGDMGANIEDMEFLERKPDFYRIKIEIHVSNIKHLLDIITSIEADTDIAEISRYRKMTSDNNVRRESRIMVDTDIFQIETSGK